MKSREKNVDSLYMCGVRLGLQSDCACLGFEFTIFSFV